MRLWVLISFLAVIGCAANNPLKEMRFMPVSSGQYTVATWYHITVPGDPVKIYIEGDGAVFDAKGRPTDDPTPKNGFFRELASKDPSPNVVYMARPCQYLMSRSCTQKDWTTGRFSTEIVDSMTGVLNQLMKKARAEQAILIGYSGGAQIAVQITGREPEKVQELVTIAGVLDQEKWTAYHKDPKLKYSEKSSVYCTSVKGTKQIHYIGKKDENVPPKLTEQIVDPATMVVVKKASHEGGFEKIYSNIWDLK